MTARRFPLLVFAGALFIGLPAMAQTAPERANSAIRSDFSKILNSLRANYKPYSDRETVTAGGRHDRVMMTNASWETVRDTYQQAHRLHTKLSNGGKIAGWYVNKTKRSATFTIHLNGHSYTLAAKETPSGTKLTLWGDVRNHAAIRNAPKHRPFHRGQPNVVPGLFRM